MNSFSGAARALRMPISTVSRKLAELEAELGVRLIERSTRNLHLTEIGSGVLRHAQHTAELSESVDTIISNHASGVTGILHLSAPASVANSLVPPLVAAFQALYPEVRVQIFVSGELNERIAEGTDVCLHIGKPKDTKLSARRILTYRHQLVASPTYLENSSQVRQPDDLLTHRLIAFSLSEARNTWTLVHASGRQRTIFFQPSLSMNDYAGLVPPLLAGSGIGELPEILRPELIRTRQLIEVMPEWHFRAVHLYSVHVAHKYIPRRVRIFNEFAAEMAPALLPGHMS